MGRVCIWFCDGCDCSVLLEEFLVIIPGKIEVLSVAVGWLSGHMRRWACCLVLFLLCLICSFENGIAIFEALHQHFPPHGAPGSTHAGDVSVFLFVRNLVIAMIHVQDTPDPEFSFSLQDVPNPWQWLCMHHCGIVDFAEVYNKPRLFLGDWKVGTAPRSLSRFSLSSTQCLITEIDPGCPSLSNHLEGSFFDWDSNWFRDNLCFVENTSFWRVPRSLPQEKCCREFPNDSLSHGFCCFSLHGISGCNETLHIADACCWSGLL